jgi:hypothetical protein
VIWGFFKDKGKIMNTQPEALRLAEITEFDKYPRHPYHNQHTAAELRRLHSVNAELLEACQTFAEWLRREDEGWVAAGNDRSTPEGEAAWREWFYENLRICCLAQDQVKAAIAKAQE